MIVDNFNKPIEWATVTWNQSSGLVTDANGIVQIKNLNDIKDSIVCSNIGYQTTILKKSDISDKKTNVVTLIEAVIELPNVIVYGNLKPEIYGYTSNKTGRGYTINKSNLSFEYVTKISGYKRNSKLQNFSLFITRESKGIVPFRIIIYEASNGQPGNRIIDKNLIIDNYKRNDWNTIDLAELRITVPDNSFFIGIEWLVKNNNQNSFLAIGNAEYMDESITYTRFGNQNFKLINFKGKSSGKFYNLMMRVTLLSN